LRGVKEFLNWLISNWERVLFAIVGLIFLAASIGLIVDEKITEAAVLFGLGLLSFIYANLARFKRFKGFGIEAELWEDKQKEAANLIQQLRGLVATYSNELLMSKVKAGRWGHGNEWANRWKLYDELVGQHQQLGQQIDFSKTKKEMDDYFLLDIITPELIKINEKMRRNLDFLLQNIDWEYSDPETDRQNYSMHLAKMEGIWSEIADPLFEVKNGDIAKTVLDKIAKAELKYANVENGLKKVRYDKGVFMEKDVTERLATISNLFQTRPVVVTDELINWTNRNA
jgi:hypothetical protein